MNPSADAPDVARASPPAVVLGTQAAAVQAMEQAIRSSLGWPVLPITAGDAAALGRVRAATARCFVLVGDADAALAAALTERSSQAPLIVVGGAPRLDLAAAGWLPAVSPPSLIATLLAQLAGSSVSSRSWRRKGDMIIGQSPAVRELLATLDRVAPSESTVLIGGESGTGKELVARALHYSGPRAAAPFIAVNCAAIPETLFESELFGHTRGAFTGAVAARAGVFEAAHGGTLFLDELGEMPLSMQAKLLRVIETGEVTRVGSTETRRINFRLVAATNRRLDDEVAAGRFREDLLYRVRVFSVHIPPLRDRPEDVAPLVSHHLAQLAGEAVAPSLAGQRARAGQRPRARDGAGAAGRAHRRAAHPTARGRDADGAELSRRARSLRGALLRAAPAHVGGQRHARGQAGQAHPHAGVRGAAPAGARPVAVSHLRRDRALLIMS